MSGIIRDHCHGFLCSLQPLGGHCSHLSCDQESGRLGQQHRLREERNVCKNLENNTSGGQK